MTFLYSRIAGWLLMIVSAALVAWTLDVQDEVKANLVTVEALHQQVKRAQPAASAQQSLSPVALDRSVVEAQALAWRVAAKSYGSDARNSAVMLERTKGLCVSSGLQDCQVKRSSLRSAGTALSVGAGLSPSGGVPEHLLPHPVNVLARFDAQGVIDFSKGLVNSGLLYRVERVNIVQNRAEWDLVFYVLSPNADQLGVLAGAVSPVTQQK